MPYTTLERPAAGYRFIPAVFQYSAGVAALPGFRIERVRFAEPVPLAEGWRRIAALLDAAGRPRAAFCACELRSPAPFTEEGFAAFNRGYAAVLAAWGVLGADGRNPVARSNVCPEVAPPAEPAFHAFCYTVPDAQAAPSFVVAGSGEAEEGHATYRDHVVAPGDVSPAGLRAKARWVLGEMERRMAALGAGWRATTGVQAYTVHDLHPFLAEEIVARGAARHGLTWQFCRPPVAGLDFEMDCRGVPVERVIAARGSTAAPS
ncbi:hypothetical protein GCM10010964_25790 [Caldovatus sediminis]|uniref:Uncharacterized protein n=1 Tax=Caldovatus sediminis TaxID=2041189 RepID=A0A8J2ZBL0_9PROT|nr:hypothetical protein [Caldovatus sediminis]GGG36784.1 hypothetical protein GCM10010964_25790 [Caldovatus sediminis]